MVEKDGILLHLELPEDRWANAPLNFTGWIVADSAVQGVRLPAPHHQRLATNDRPDVQKVFPNRFVAGFVGHARPENVRTDSLRLEILVGGETKELDHPLPPALIPRPILHRIKFAVRLAALRWQTRRAPTADTICALTLQRHLIYRAQRSGAFRRSHVEALLADFSSAMPEARFLQIGANDGVTGDPIHHLIVRRDTRWRGVLVEPVPHLFARLQKKYANDPNLHLEQAAISDHDGEVELFRLQIQAGDSLWLEQIPSLDLPLLQKSARTFGADEKEIIRETVPCLTIATLLDRHRISSLDLLVIDTEGADWTVLQQFHLERLQPKLILYEHQHLAPPVRQQAQQFLIRAGYDFAEIDEGDTLAWKLD